MNAQFPEFEMPLGATLFMLGVATLWFVAVPVAACIWAGRRFGGEPKSGTILGVLVAVVLGGLAYSCAQLPWLDRFVYASPLVLTAAGPISIYLLTRIGFD